MYNPNHYYEQHMHQLKALREQAAHDRMVAALAPERWADLRAALVRLGALRVRLGAWLAQPARPAEPPACTCEC